MKKRDENLLAGMKMFRKTLLFCKTSRKILDINVSAALQADWAIFLAYSRIRVSQLAQNVRCVRADLRIFSLFLEGTVHTSTIRIFGCLWPFVSQHDPPDVPPDLCVFLRLQQ